MRVVIARIPFFFTFTCTKKTLTGEEIYFNSDYDSFPLPFQSFERQ